MSCSWKVERNSFIENSQKFISHALKPSKVTVTALPIIVLLAQSTLVHASSTSSSTPNYCPYPDEYFNPDCAIKYSIPPYNQQQLRSLYNGNSRTSCENLLDQFGNDWCTTYFNDTDFVNDPFDDVFDETNAKLAARYRATGVCIITTVRNESAVRPEVFCDSFRPVNASDYVPLPTQGSSSSSSHESSTPPDSSNLLNTISGSLFYSSRPDSSFDSHAVTENSPSKSSQSEAASVNTPDQSDQGSVRLTNLTEPSSPESPSRTQQQESLDSNVWITTNDYVAIEVIISSEVVIINHHIYGEIPIFYDAESHALNIGIDLSELEDGEEISLFTYASDFDADSLDLILDSTSTCKSLESDSVDAEVSDRSVYVVRVVEDRCTNTASVHTIASSVLATAFSLLPPMYQRMATRLVQF